MTTVTMGDISQVLDQAKVPGQVRTTQQSERTRTNPTAPDTGRGGHECRLARRFLISSATTSGRTVAGLRWPHWSSCSLRWASRRPRSVPRSPGWSARAGCCRCGCPAAPGTSSPPKAVRRLDESASRIYRTNPVPWDGAFDLLLVDLPGPRAERLRMTANLTFLGYGSLGDGTWIAPRPAQEATALLDESGVRYERFTARRTGPGGAGRPDQPGLGPAGHRGRLRPVRGQPDCGGGQPGRTDATNTRTRPDSTWYMPGVVSCSGIRNCPATCSPSSGLGTRRRPSSTSTPDGCGRPPTGTWTPAWSRRPDRSLRAGTPATSPGAPRPRATEHRDPLRRAAGLEEPVTDTLQVDAGGRGGDGDPVTAPTR